MNDVHFDVKGGGARRIEKLSVDKGFRLGTLDAPTDAISSPGWLRAPCFASLVGGKCEEKESSLQSYETCDVGVDCRAGVAARWPLLGRGGSCGPAVRPSRKAAYIVRHGFLSGCGFGDKCDGACEHRASCGSVGTAQERVWMGWSIVRLRQGGGCFVFSALDRYL